MHKPKHKMPSFAGTIDPLLFNAHPSKDRHVVDIMIHVLSLSRHFNLYSCRRYNIYPKLRLHGDALCCHKVSFEMMLF